MYKKIKIFLKVALRNLIRARKRTAFTGVGILISTMMMVLGFHYGDSIIKSLLDSASNNLFSDITIFSKAVELESEDSKEQFSKMMEPHKTSDSLIEYSKVKKGLADIPDVKIIHEKIKIGGMIYNGDQSIECFILGITPGREIINPAKIEIIEGNYLSGKGEIILSKQIAREINTKKGDKIVLLTSNLNGGFSGQKFKVVGVANYYGMEMFLSTLAYVHIDDARSLLGVDQDKCSFVTVKLKDKNSSERVAFLLNDFFQKNELNFKAVSYLEAGKIFVEMGQMQKFMVTITTLFFYIIAFVGLTSNILVNIFKRVREIGVLRALGASSGDIRIIFVLENMLLTAFAGFLGCTIATGIVFLLSKIGIPAASESFKILYAGEKLYFSIFISDIVSPFLLVFFVTFFWTFLISNKAGKLKPAEAMKYV